jgi:hypothetical protein
VAISGHRHRYACPSPLTAVRDAELVKSSGIGTPTHPLTAQGMPRW